MNNRQADQDQPPKCYICGKPATHAARDYVDASSWAESTASYAPAPYIKYGCDEHKPQSNYRREVVW